MHDKVLQVSLHRWLPLEPESLEVMKGEKRVEEQWEQKVLEILAKLWKTSSRQKKPTPIIYECV